MTDQTTQEALSVLRALVELVRDLPPSSAGLHGIVLPPAHAAHLVDLVAQGAEILQGAAPAAPAAPAARHTLATVKTVTDQSGREYRFDPSEDLDSFLARLPRAE
jgi:hypothetical protein